MEKEDLEELKIEEDESFTDLEHLKVSAPENTFDRLEKRIKIALVGKDLVEKQAFAFWTIIDAFLRLLFVPNKNDSVEEKNIGDKE